MANSRYVYENRWLRVREDALLRPDGSAGLYAVVERADFAVIIPCHRGGLMLVEQYRHPLGRRSLEFLKVRMSMLRLVLWTRWPAQS